MLKTILVAGGALIGVALIAPAASAHNTTLSFHHFSIGDDDEDLLDQLIELDAEDIADIREEMADAREDIRDAILDIEDAREEAKAAPGGKSIVNAALKAASAIVDSAVSEALDEVRSELDSAERRLPGRADEIGADEVAETQLAIDTIREEIVEVEAALEELLDVMRA